MVKKLKPKKKKPRYLVEVQPGGVITSGFCYRVIQKTGSGPDDYAVVKDWYGDYPTSKHANDAGRRWVFDHYDPELGAIPQSES